MGQLELKEKEDESFLKHAKATFDRRFKLIATPIHWLALFLHPLCRKLAVSNKAGGHDFKFMLKAALMVAKQWRWSEEKAHKLRADLTAYNQFKSPFTGGSKDAKDWWEGIAVENHREIRVICASRTRPHLSAGLVDLSQWKPVETSGDSKTSMAAIPARALCVYYREIRTLAIVLASIIPHAADVERLFSDLGGTQTPHQNGMTVDHMEKYGKIGVASPMNFMNPTNSIDGDLAKDLENPISWIPPLRVDDGPEVENGNIVEQAYQDLQRTLDDEASEASANSESAPELPVASVVGGQVVNFAELDKVDHREVALASAEVIDVAGDAPRAAWRVDDMIDT
ncbi:hypothetical protein C8J57DRAFT_1523749 [Mycena rebaudengoi]|nr:hypothetical protein C8J57DRAFT_1523749 [Mycena rebaudengoi]